jgi:UTP--glucose-1-phosphate uridylyltransferase
MTGSIRTAVFPVAGFGTRFLPATKAMPKELLPVIDKPIIQYAVEEAIAAGIETMVFVTGRHKRAIEDHFDANAELEMALLAKGKEEAALMVRNVIPSHVNCVFVRQPEQLGLGHAVACAEPVVGNEPFAVLLADDFIVPDASRELNTTGDLIAQFNATGKSQLSVMNVEDGDVGKYGIIDPGPQVGDVDGLIEKPNLADAPSRLASIGRYVLTGDIFETLKDLPKGAGGEIQLADAINIQARANGVGSVLLTDKRFDCGSVKGYTDAILFVSEKMLSNLK